MSGTFKFGDGAEARVIKRAPSSSGIRLKGVWHFEARDKHGNLKWTDTAENLITNAGLDHALDVSLSGATATAAWWIGLTDGTPTVAAGDTMASHAGWTEVTDYTEGTRGAFGDNTVSGQSIANAAKTFTINTTVTVGGAFLSDLTTKGGATGVLFSVVAFTGGDKSLVNLDTLDVTYTVTAADA